MRHTAAARQCCASPTDKFKQTYDDARVCLCRAMQRVSTHHVHCHWCVLRNHNDKTDSHFVTLSQSSFCTTQSANAWLQVRNGKDPRKKKYWNFLSPSTVKWRISFYVAVRCWELSHEFGFGGRTRRNVFSPSMRAFSNRKSLPRSRKVKFKSKIEINLFTNRLIYLLPMTTATEWTFIASTNAIECNFLKNEFSK